uniref:Fucosyltransferase n=1 Tax=Panagrolaimus superbus TaxID=310955 RepID=A0A914YX18_9BILA
MIMIKPKIIVTHCTLNYGNCFKNITLKHFQINSAIKFKSKGLLILVSNCDTLSSREYLIEALSQQLPITIYGKCSKNDCNSECEKAAIKEHLFYLAFENSICNEYVTEKFWRMKDLIVPIVLNRNVTSPVAPDESFIAVDDFQSVEKLADYLNLLMNNMEEYKKYFSWTKEYKKTYDKPNLACNLCKFAWELRTNSTNAKSMLPTYDEWISQSQCKLNYALSLMTSEELNKTSFFPLHKKLLFLIIPLMFLIFALMYAYRDLSFYVAKVILSRFNSKI